MAISDLCPDCGGPLEWDEVDIGVGVQRGPSFCLDPECQYNRARAKLVSDAAQAIEECGQDELEAYALKREKERGNA